MTRWERVPITSVFTGSGQEHTLAPYLQGTHTLWSRLTDGEMIYTVRPNDETPGTGDGGYRSIAAALQVKGMDVTR